VVHAARRQDRPAAGVASLPSGCAGVSPPCPPAPLFRAVRWSWVLVCSAGGRCTPPACCRRPRRRNREAAGACVCLPACGALVTGRLQAAGAFDCLRRLAWGVGGDSRGGALLRACRRRVACVRRPAWFRGAPVAAPTSSAGARQRAPGTARPPPRPVPVLSTLRSSSRARSPLVGRAHVFVHTTLRCGGGRGAWTVREVWSRACGSRFAAPSPGEPRRRGPEGVRPGLARAGDAGRAARPREACGGSGRGARWGRRRGRRHDTPTTPELSLPLRPKSYVQSIVWVGTLPGH